MKPSIDWLICAALAVGVACFSQLLPPPIRRDVYYVLGIFVVISILFNPSWRKLFRKNKSAAPVAQEKREE